MPVPEPSSELGLWPLVRAITGWPEPNEDAVLALAGGWRQAGQSFAQAGAFDLAPVSGGWQDAAGAAYSARVQATLQKAVLAGAGMEALAGRAEQFAQVVTATKQGITELINANLPIFRATELLPPGIREVARLAFVGQVATMVNALVTSAAGQVTAAAAPAEAPKDEAGKEEEEGDPYEKQLAEKEKIRERELLNKKKGTQSDGLFTDKIIESLEKLGVVLPEGEKYETPPAEVELLGDKVGDKDTGAGYSLLGANAGAKAEVGPLSLSGSAEAEAYLAKGNAQGELPLGEHAKLTGKVEGIVGAQANAEGSIGPSGVKLGGEAFAGAKVEGTVGAEVAGLGAGVTGEAWAGIGAEASGQFGFGDDGKFHIGASVGAALGIGGKVGVDVSVDPAEVVSTFEDITESLGL